MGTVLRGPPGCEVPFGIGLAAFIVEAVGDLVPDGAGGCITVDHGVVRQGIRQAGQHEDAGGQYDLVVAGVVVGVVGLGRHIPFGAVHRLAPFAHLIVEVPAVGGQHVGGIAHGVDLQRAVVLPHVGIAHFLGHGVEFFQGFFLGGVAHPVQVLDALAVGAADRFHQAVIALFGALGEVVLHEDLAHDHPNGAAFLVDDPLPTRALLFLSVELRGVEVEVLLVDGAAEVAREGGEQVIAEIVLKGGHGRGLQQTVHGGEEFRLAHDHRVTFLEAVAV